MEAVTKKGFVLEQNKLPAAILPIEAFRSEDTAYVPLCVFPEEQMNLKLNPGASVARGEIISVSDQGCPVCSPYDGVLEAINGFAHPRFGKAPAARIRLKGPWVPLEDVPETDPSYFLVDEIHEKAKTAGIFDETDNKRLFRKLDEAAGAGCQAVVLNTIDDEPYLSSNIRTFFEHTRSALLGLRLAANAVGAKNIYIAKTDYDDVNMPFPAGLNIPVLSFKDMYPFEADPPDKLQAYRHPLWIGAQAAVALYNSVVANLPQTSAVVTLSGSGVLHPVNVEAPFGTPVKALIKYCGFPENCRVIEGGPMTGEVLPEEAAVYPGMRAITAVDDPLDQEPEPCIGCGQCGDDCPRNLLPSYIVADYNNGKYMKALKWGIRDCIECGCCSAVCPSRIHVRKVMSDTKIKILQIEMAP